MTPRDRYEAWLRARGATGEVRTGPSYPGSPFELFFVAAGPPGTKHLPAAASEALVVAPEVGEGWGAFLRSADAATLQRQIGWLHGAWIPRDAPPPTVEAQGDGVRFEAAYAAPPSLSPFRFRVVVDGRGRATFEYEGGA